MAFQMVVIIFGAAYGGVKLDDWMSSVDFPVFTVGLTIFGVFAAVYLSLRDLLKNNKDN